MGHSSSPVLFIDSDDNRLTSLGKTESRERGGGREMRDKGGRLREDSPVERSRSQTGKGRAGLLGLSHMDETEDD